MWGDHADNLAHNRSKHGTRCSVPVQTASYDICHTWVKSDFLVVISRTKWHSAACLAPPGPEVAERAYFVLLYMDFKNHTDMGGENEDGRKKIVNIWDVEREMPKVGIKSKEWNRLGEGMGGSIEQSKAKGRGWLHPTTGIVHFHTPNIFRGVTKSEQERP